MEINGKGIGREEDVEREEYGYEECIWVWSRIYISHEGASPAEIV